MYLHTFPLNPFVREVEGCGKYDCASKIHTDTVLRIASPVCMYILRSAVDCGVVVGCDGCDGCKINI